MFSMISHDLLKVLNTLTPSEKIWAIRYLADQLAQDNDAPELKAGVAYPVWLPLEAYEAGNLLLEELEKVRKAP